MTDAISETVCLYDELYAYSIANLQDKEGKSNKCDALLKQMLDSYLYDIGSVTEENVKSVLQQSVCKMGDNDEFVSPIVNEEVLRQMTVGLIPLFVFRIICQHNRNPGFMHMVHMGTLSEFHRFVKYYGKYIFKWIFHT